MKQIDLFGEELRQDVEIKYTDKIDGPSYVPSNSCPHILELVDTAKYSRLVSEIKNADVSEQEKSFLIHAASRHCVFNYSKVADYYAHASKPMQELMEKSALVIIDFNRAIELGYIKLSEDLTKQYLTEYGNREQQ